MSAQLTNLVEFYSVSTANETLVFLSEKEALRHCQGQNERLKGLFVLWENGVPGFDYLIQSSLECDEHGQAAKDRTVNL